MALGFHRTRLDTKGVGTRTQPPRLPPAVPLWECPPHILKAHTDCAAAVAAFEAVATAGVDPTNRDELRECESPSKLKHQAHACNIKYNVGATPSAQRHGAHSSLTCPPIPEFEPAIWGGWHSRVTKHCEYLSGSISFPSLAPQVQTGLGSDQGEAQTSAVNSVMKKILKVTQEAAALYCGKCEITYGHVHSSEVACDAKLTSLLPDDIFTSIITVPVTSFEMPRPSVAPPDQTVFVAAAAYPGGGRHTANVLNAFVRFDQPFSSILAVKTAPMRAITSAKRAVSGSANGSSLDVKLEALSGRFG